MADTRKVLVEKFNEVDWFLHSLSENIRITQENKIDYMDLKKFITIYLNEE